MSELARKVVIVPCSGIGKPHGSVSREAAYEVVEELRPQTTVIVPLALLVLGDEAARGTVSTAPTITIDGCKLMCAAKLVQQSGGTVVLQATVMDVYRRNRHLKAQGIAQLNEAGLELARVLAAEVVGKVDLLTEPAPELMTTEEVPHA